MAVIECKDHPETVVNIIPAMKNMGERADAKTFTVQIASEEGW
jgi:hypothetical protein